MLCLLWLSAQVEGAAWMAGARGVDRDRSSSSLINQTTVDPIA